MVAGRKAQTFLVNGNAPPTPNPTNSILATRNLSKSQLGGVVFGCKNSTYKECLFKQLFGMSCSFQFHFFQHLFFSYLLFLNPIKLSFFLVKKVHSEIFFMDFFFFFFANTFFKCHGNCCLVFIRLTFSTLFICEEH